MNLSLVSHAVLWLNCSVGACSHKRNFRHGTIRRTPYQRATLLRVATWLRRSVDHNSGTQSLRITKCPLLTALISNLLRIGTQAHYRGIRQVSLQAVLFGSLLTRKLASLVQFSKQNFMPPCSIKEIAQTAPKHFQHIHSLCSKF